MVVFAVVFWFGWGARERGGSAICRKRGRGGETRVAFVDGVTFAGRSCPIGRGATREMISVDVVVVVDVVRVCGG